MIGFHEHSQVYGAAIVEKVLTDQVLFKQWKVTVIITSFMKRWKLEILTIIL